MKTRILFVIDGIEFGGGERVFSQIINGLPQERFEAYLAANPNEAFQNAILPGYARFFPFDFSNRYNAANLFKLKKIIKDYRIDIVHGQGARAEFYARLAAGFSDRRTCISTVAMPVEGYDVRPIKRLLYKAFDCFSERYVDRFLVVSDILVQSMMQGHGVPPGKVIKIYNGIETERYHPDQQAANRVRIRQEFHISETDIFVGAIGRLVWQKGFEFFLEAIPTLAGERDDLRFIIVGDGNLHRQLVEMADALKIKHCIHFPGQRTDIRDILAALDIVVIPSLLEGFPMVTLEAMAMAKPIVATAIDGITEQITDAREGLLTPPRNPEGLSQAILKIASDPSLARHLGENARARVVKDFSVQQMIEATIKVYDEFI